MASPSPDESKLKEMILYVSLVSEDDPNFGAMKLNKVLFYADFLHFLETGTAISGVEYQRNFHGPTARRMLPVQRALVEAGAAIYKKVHARPMAHDRFIVLHHPNLTKFSASEVATIDRVLRNFEELTGAAVENRPHEFIWWRLAKQGETIPYGVVAVPNVPIDLTDDEAAWAIGVVDADGRTDEQRTATV